jgi:hypothetical protein
MMINLGVLGGKPAQQRVDGISRVNEGTRETLERKQKNKAQVNMMAGPPSNRSAKK